MPQPQGEVKKLRIIAYHSDQTDDSKKAGDFEAMINPESYVDTMKMVPSYEQGNGTSGQKVKFTYITPNELTFEFLFDNTGIIDGKPNKAGISENLEALKKLIFQLDGDIHEPRHVQLIWGTYKFIGRVTDMVITYKLFNPDGSPIRAMVKLTIVSSIEEKLRVAQEGKHSPDLTHKRIFKQGDSLPWLCDSIYGSPKYYLQVARANGISNFRKIKEGTEINFPPFDKTA